MSDAAMAATATEQSPSSTQTADAQAVAAAKQAEKFKVKIDDAELEVDLEELKRGYGHSKAANKRFQEAAAKEKQVADLLRRAQSGDLSWLKGIVPDEKMREYAQQELLQYIEYESLPDHEKELRSERSRREQLEKSLKEREQAEQAEKEKALMSRAYQEIDQDITGVLKDLGKKPTPRLVRRIAEEMLATLETEDAKPITAKDAFARARHGITQDVQEYLQEVDAAELVKLLPKQKLDAIRQQFVEGVIPASIKPRSIAPSDSAKTGKRVRASSDDFFNKLEKRIGAR
jgi:hypothetical protein